MDIVHEFKVFDSWLNNVIFLPWPPVSTSKRYRVNLVIENLKGLPIDDDSSSNNDVVDECAVDNSRRLGLRSDGRVGMGRVAGLGLPFGRRISRRISLRVDVFRNAGAWEWNEEFENVCVFMASKEGKDPLCFQPWDVCFSVIDQLTQETRSKRFVLDF